MLKTLVKCMTKTAEVSAKEATKRKKDQHILLKVQDTDLAAREVRYFQLIPNHPMLIIICGVFKFRNFKLDSVALSKRLDLV